MYRIRYLLIAAALAMTSVAIAQKSIAERQYWIDGNIAEAQTLAESPTSISIGNLKPGMHSLTVRVKDSEGLWSSQVAKYFIVPFASTSVTSNSIEKHQYWIDGNLQAAVTSASKPSAIVIGDLNPGLHSLTVRVQDKAGLWSSQVAKYFIVPQEETVVEEKRIVLHQYWIDGKLDAIVSSETQPSQIPISTLKPGLHSLTVRVKDNTGLWSSQVAKYFIVKDDVMEETTITRYMYWFDEETDDFKTGSLTSASGTMDIDISDVEAGIHTLWWRCGDSKGAWSEARSVTFESKSLYNYTVPASGIGTFSADVNLTLPDGLKAHFCTYLKEVDEGLAIKILNIDGRVINQNTGVLLSGTPGETYQLRYTSEAGSATEGNQLVPVVESKHIESVTGDYTNYMMKGGRFIKIKEEDGSVMMPAHRAYLPLLTTAVGEAKSIVLLLNDEETTRVVAPDLTPKMEDGVYYNLQGQRVEPQRGTGKSRILIKNGRKVIVK